MKFSAFFFILGLGPLVGCASSPKPVVFNEKPKVNIAQLDATFCHMQLTDLFETVSADKTYRDPALAPNPQSLYALRMELRQKINQWVQQDAGLAVECQRLAFEVQNQWRQREEFILSQYRNEQPSEQRVFTNSQWQLFSNPLLTDGAPATSVSELRNGDVILADDKIFVIAKNENGEMHSWMSDAPTHWVRLSMQHSMGWLKQPAKRVVALRHWNSTKASQVVQWVQSHQRVNYSEQRRPSSLWNFMGASAELELEANPHFLQVFEWRNHSSLTKP